MSPLPKLFIPGPVDVSPEIFAAMCAAPIGHRGGEYEKLHAATQPGLKAILGTERPVYLSTSSAWGVMEGALRNLTNKAVLNCCCGAFSDKWFDVAQRCEKRAVAYQVEWGEALNPKAIRTYLESGEFDSITVVHNETSTGVMNPLKEIAEVVRDFPEVMLIVDCVSSLSAVPVEMDAWGIDVLLAGVQKAFALPPGLAVFAVSEEALKRAKITPGRGYYFDFIEFEKNAVNNNTPSTPTVPHIYGLRRTLELIEEEGLAQRFARHAQTNQMIHDWGARHGFEHFAPEGFRSKTLTTFHTPKDFDQTKFISRLKSEHGFLINGGYGKIKGLSFRISNMGNETPETMQELIDAMDQVLATM